MKPFVPDDFYVPTRLAGEDFLLRPLTINDVVKDYDAVMTSRDRLADLFGPGHGWPAPDLTLEQDLIDLGWHQKEFQTRRSFAYTAMTPDDSQCLGCAYVEPSPKQGYDAQVFFWVRDSALDTGLETRLAAALHRWLAERWCFERVAWPGRDTPWAEWLALPDNG